MPHWEVTDRRDRIHPVHYRDIDLGYRREVIYTDVVTYLGGDDQGSEFDFGLSTWEELFSGQDDHFYNEAYSGAINWEHIQHTSALPIRDRSSIASLYEPLPPLSIISENALEDSSRPTTSSTNRKDSGEFLRRLQTGSSVGTRLHSRNISDASEITLPLSEDYYDPREAPAGENPSMLARTTECEAGQGHSIYSDEAEIAASQFAQGRMEADDDFVDYDDGPEEIMRLQAPPYVNFEWYEVNDLHESIPFDEEEHMETSRRNEMDTIHIDHESQKGHSLHVEQPIDDDNRSFISNYPDDHDVSTKTYGVFDAAFAQQVKDYSKLLDDLADPHATAQALGLVSSRLSLYLNSNSSADITSGRCVETEAAEKRQQMALPDLSDLGAFLDDDDNDDDADSGFHVSSTKFFACPAKPRPTPFADLKQFVDDDDLDLDMDSASRKKPVLNSFMGWTLSAGDEDENSEVLTDRTALRTRPPLRRTC